MLTKRRHASVKAISIFLCICIFLSNVSILVYALRSPTDISETDEITSVVESFKNEGAPEIEEYPKSEEDYDVQEGSAEGEAVDAKEGDPEAEQILKVGEDLNTAELSQDQSILSLDASGENITITTLSELEELRVYMAVYDGFSSKAITLGADIDLSDPWEPIGTQEVPFKGTFDGDGYTISSLKIDNSQNSQGFFGYVDGTKIKNITLTDVKIKGGSNVGAVAGYAKDSCAFENIAVKGDVEGNGTTGGIVGYAEKDSAFENLMVEGSVRGGSYTGGIVGQAGNGCTFEGLSMDGIVQGGSCTGGIVGQAGQDNTFSNCVNDANVSGGSFVSGIIGNINSGGKKAYLSDCHNSGPITSTASSQYIGGIVASMYASDVIIEGCSNEGDLTVTSSNQRYIGGIVGSINASSQQQITECYNGGDIVDVVQSGYSYLGGIVGMVQQSNATKLIEKCYNTGKLKGGRYVGGIVGYQNNYFYSNQVNICYNTGSIASGGDYVGGIAGQLGRKAFVTNSYNAGSIEATNPGVKGAGGIAGSNDTNGSYQERCFNYGSISAAGKSNVGAIAGINFFDNAHCYYLLPEDDTVFADRDSATGMGILSFYNGYISYLLDDGDDVFRAGIWGQGEKYPAFVDAGYPTVYKISVPGAVSGGSVKIFNPYVKAGDKGQVAVTPQEGNILKLITVSLTTTGEHIASGGGKDTTSVAFTMPASNVLADAQFVAAPPEGSSFNVTFDLAGGQWPGGFDPGTLSTAVAGGGNIPEPEVRPVKEVQGFGGWHYQGRAYDFATAVTEDMTLEAQWLEGEDLCSVSFNVNRGGAEGSETPATAYILKGETVPRPADPIWKSDDPAIFYGFLGWYRTPRPAEGERPWDFDGDKAERDMTLYAVWELSDPFADGGEGAPYLIGSEEELRALSARVMRGTSYEGKYFALAKDIALEQPWTPIGTQESPFKGNFDGDGYTISGLEVTGNENYRGLFGYVSGASIKDVTVKGTISGNNYVGGIAGYAVAETKLEGCTSFVEIKGQIYVGGIVGEAEARTSFEACENQGEVKGNGYVGGIAGRVGQDVRFEDCSNSRDIIGYSHIGGICGGHDQNLLTFIRCSNTGDITAEGSGDEAINAKNAYAGGILGKSGTGVRIEDCTNEGAIVAQGRFAGGIAGRVRSAAGTPATFINCVNLGEVESVLRYTGGIVGGIMNSRDDYSGGESAALQGCRNEGRVRASDYGIFGSPYTGGIAGEAGFYAELAECSNLGNIVAEGEYTGGIAGNIGQGAAVANCYNQGTITGGTNYTGGIAGWMESTAVELCFNTGEVKGLAGRTVGGIAGFISRVTLVHCYNTGDIASNSQDAIGIGGIVGNNVDSSYSYAKHCYNYGKISSKASGVTGAIFGTNFSNNENCYYLNTGISSPADKSNAKDLKASVFKSGEAAYLLDDGDSAKRTSKWSQGENYPIFADDNHLPIYRVLIAEGIEGGSISLDRAFVTAGVTVKPAMEIAENYSLKLLAVRGRDDGSVIHTAKADESIDFIMPDQSVFINAEFGPTPTQDKYTVTFDANGGLFDDNTQTKTVEAEVFKAVAPPSPDPIKLRDEKTDYIFSGWYLGEKTASGDVLLLKPYDFNAGVIEDFTLYARWVAGGELTVRFDLGAADGILKPIQNQRKFRTDKLDNPGELLWQDTPAIKREFLGWSTTSDGSSYWNFETNTIPGDFEGIEFVLYARWKITDIFDTGTKDAPFQIYNPELLSELAKLVNGGKSYKGKHFVLAADIDLSAASWMPIGKKEAPFEGNFSASAKGYDGKHCEITGLSLTGEGDYCGLFGYVKGATLQNISVSGSVSGGNYIGGITGYADAGTRFIGCINHSSVISTSNNSYAGGIAAYAAGGVTFEECQNEGDVKGVSYAGGIVGYTSNGSSNAKTMITECSNEGSITGTGNNSYAGGTVGYIGNYAELQNCSNEKTVKGYYIGGVAGYIGTYAKLQDCYNTAAISGKGQYTGGVAGQISTSAELINCYNTGKITGSGSAVYTSYTGGVAGSIGNTATIRNCHSEGGIIAGGGGGARSGGIVGNIGTNATFQDCCNTGDITGNGSSYVGGIAGYINSNLKGLTNSYNTGDVTIEGASSRYISGIAGYLNGGSTGREGVRTCYNTGDIFGGNNVGGIFGYARNMNEPMTLCYNTGSITAFDTAGGLVGFLGGASRIADSYNVGEISSDSEDFTGIGGITGVNDNDKGTYVEGCYNYASIPKGSGAITSDYYYRNRNCLYNAVAVTEPVDADFARSMEAEDFAKGFAAYMLDGGGTSHRTGKWSQGAAYPIFADAEHPPVYKLTIIESEKGKVQIENLGEVHYFPKGFDVSLSIVPEKDFILKLLKAVGQSGERYAITYEEDNIAKLTMPEADVTVMATFIEAPVGGPFTVTFDSGEGTLVEQQTVVAGKRAAKPADPEKEDYRFLGWYLNGVEFDFDTAITANVTLVAKWRAVRFAAVTFDPNRAPGETGEGGIVIVEVESGCPIGDKMPADPTWYSSDSTMSYTFNGWYTQKKGGEQWASEDSKVGEENMVLYARWKAEDLLLKGTVDDPVEISDAETLLKLAQRTNAGTSYEDCYFELTGDIDLSILKWTPIGTVESPFKGNFSAEVKSGADEDALYYEIKGLSIATGYDRQGLFGFVKGSIFKNLRVSGTITGEGYIGGIAGNAVNAQFIDCINYCSITGRGRYIGGIAGYIESSYLENCFNEGRIVGGANYTGGLVGDGSSSSMMDCYNNGEVKGKTYTGGIMGRMSSKKSFIKGCHNVGKVSGSNQYIGGIAGQINSTSMENCRNADKIIGGTTYTGGIVGQMNSSSLAQCYNEGEVTGGTTHTGGVAGHIVGRLNSSTPSMEHCYNVGAVKGGTQYTGGVAGYADSSTYVKYCYNADAGMVTGGLGQYTGGVLGGVNSLVILEACFNQGVINGHTGNDVGGVLGGAYAYDSVLIDCYNDGEVIGGAGQNTGGVMGYITNRTGMQNCYNAGIVTGGSGHYIGGVAGKIQTNLWNNNGRLQNCFNIGDVIAKGGGNFVGGIAGYISSLPDNIGAFYNTGNIKSNAAVVGGITGYLASGQRLTACFNGGTIEANGAGAIVGDGFKANENCYYLEESIAAPMDRDYIQTFTQEALMSGEAAYLLNGGIKKRNDLWSQGEIGPVFVEEGKQPIYKIWVEDDIDFGNVEVEKEYVEAKSQVIPIIKPAEGYVLQLFTVKDTGGRIVHTAVYEDSPTFTMPDASDVTLNAKFGLKPIQGFYTVTFNANGGVLDGGDEEKLVTVATFGKVDKPADPERAADEKTSYSFGGWYLGEEISGEVNLTELYDFNSGVLEDFTLYAKWFFDDQITVRFDLTAARKLIPQIPDQLCFPGDLVERPGDPEWPEEEGIKEIPKFLGWSIEAFGEDYWDFERDRLPKILAGKRLLLYAIWSGADMFLTGTEDDPFPIENASVLALLAERVNQGNSYAENYFKLAEDIDLGDYPNWTPIGTRGKPFSGNFDGDSFTISGLSISTGSDYRGLFGYVEGATIKNLTVEGEVKGKGNIGGIAGYAERSDFEACISDVTVKGEGIADDRIGGIVGRAKNVSLKHCENIGSIDNYTSDDRMSGYAGGLVGEALGASNFQHCTNEGEVRGDIAGGIVGKLDDRGKFAYCTNQGKITSNNKGMGIGGIVGEAGNYVEFENCENRGEIDALVNVGGIAGFTGERPNFKGCRNEGTVTVYGTGREPTNGYGHNAYGGGIVGSAKKGSTYFECRNTGDIISYGRYTGGIAGYALSDKKNPVNFIECYNEGLVTGRFYYAGGIAGCVEDYVTVESCHNSGKIEKNYDASVPFDSSEGQRFFYVGGILGHTGKSATFTGCRNEGEIVNAGYFGGVVGWLGSESEVEGCNNTGGISNSSTGGGVLGEVGGDSKVTNCNNDAPINGFYIGGVANSIGFGVVLTNCYNTGNITGENLGGVVRSTARNTKLEDCYNAGSVTGKNVGGVVEKTGDGTELLNCRNEGAIRGTGGYIGGVAGETGSGIRLYHESSGAYEYNKGSITGENVEYTGGIIGKLGPDASIKEGYNSGAISVTGESTYLGGLFGDVADIDAQGLKCYNTGDITSTAKFIGGIAGRLSGKVTHGYNQGAIEASGADAAVGGITGHLSGQLSNCYNLGYITADEGVLVVGGIVGENSDGTESAKGAVKGCYNYGGIAAFGAEVGAISGRGYSDNSGGYYNADVLKDPVDAELAASMAEAQFAGGEVAYHLDGGTGEHLSVWTQGSGYPVWGTPSYYKIDLVVEGEGGSISIQGKDDEIYRAMGDDIPVDVDIERYPNAATRIKYEYVLESLTVTQKGGTEIDIADTRAFTLDEGDAVVKAVFAIKEIQEEQPPEEKPEEGGEGPGKGDNPGGGEGPGKGDDPGSGEGTGKGEGPGSDIGTEDGKGKGKTGDSTGGGSMEAPTTDTVIAPDPKSKSQEDLPVIVVKPSEVKKLTSEDESPEGASLGGGGSGGRDAQVQKEPEPKEEEPEEEEPEEEDVQLTVFEIVKKVVEENPMITVIVILTVLGIVITGALSRYRRYKQSK